MSKRRKRKNNKMDMQKNLEAKRWRRIRRKVHEGLVICDIAILCLLAVWLMFQIWVYLVLYDVLVGNAVSPGKIILGAATSGVELKAGEISEIMLCITLPAVILIGLCDECFSFKKTDYGVFCLMIFLKRKVKTAPPAPAFVALSVPPIFCAAERAMASPIPKLPPLPL